MGLSLPFQIFLINNITRRYYKHKKRRQMISFREFSNIVDETLDETKPNLERKIKKFITNEEMEKVKEKIREIENQLNKEEKDAAETN